MKIQLLTALFFLAGCAVQPETYDLNTTDNFPPIQTKKNITNLDIGTFKYEPPSKISQFNASNMACLPCMADGSTPGIFYSSPINEIVKAEVKKGLQEVMIPSKTPECKLNATIHLVAISTIKLGTTVDLTYTITKEEQIKFVKRIRGYHDSELFEGHRIERLFAKASRQSLSLLVTDHEFLKSLQDHCSN